MLLLPILSCTTGCWSIESTGATVWARRWDRAADAGPMMSVKSSIRSLGGIAKKGELLARGHSADAVYAATLDGSIVRIRKGWYGTSDLPEATVRAVRVGGRLACLSAAAHYGLWVPDSSTLHVGVPRRGSRLRTADDHRKRLAEHPDDPITVHWTRAESAGDRHAVSLTEALDQVFRCEGVRPGFVVLESALSQGRLTRLEAEGLARSLRSDARDAASVAGPFSESGTESMVKFELCRLGIPFRQQVVIGGAGPVDFLVGECLVIEVDSRQHHSDPYRDRKKDAELGIHGCRVLRFMYSQIIYEWPIVEQAILAAIARGDHRAH